VVAAACETSNFIPLMTFTFEWNKSLVHLLEETNNLLLLGENRNITVKVKHCSSEQNFLVFKIIHVQCSKAVCNIYFNNCTTIKRQ
jgi:hypothetical protein